MRGMRGWSGAWRRERLVDAEDVAPPVEVSFTAEVTPAERRGQTLAKGLAVDLALAADEGEREMVLGELFVEVVPDPTLAGQVIIALASALVDVASLAVQRDASMGPGGVSGLLERTFDAKPAPPPVSD